jgi:hypothetical protein
MDPVNLDLQPELRRMASAFSRMEDGKPHQITYYEHGTVTIDDAGIPTISNYRLGNREAVKRLINERGKITLLIAHHNFVKHYFHFLEIILAVYAFIHEHLGNSTIGNIVIGSQDLTSYNNNDVQPDLIHALLPGSVVLRFLPSSDLGMIRDILGYGTSGSRSPLNKAMQEDVHTIARWMPEIVSDLLKYLQIPLTRETVSYNTGSAGYLARVNVVYAKRGGARRLSDGVESWLIRTFDEFGAAVETVDFGALRFVDQVKIARNCDILFGAHGNNLSNLVWMRPGSAVCEFFPAEYHTYDYQMLAEVADVQYLGIEGREEAAFIYTDHTRISNGFYGADAYNREITGLPWADVRALIAMMIRKVRGL